MTSNDTPQPVNRSLSAALPPISAAAATILLLIAAYFFSPQQYYSQALTGWAFVVMAFMAALPALWSWSRHASVSTDNPSHAAPRPIRWRMFMVALVGMLLVTQANALDLSMAWFSHHLQMLLLVVSIILTALALGGLVIPAYPAGETPGALIKRGLRWLWTRQDAQALLAIIAIGAGLRLYNLEYGIHRLVDEINFVDPILRLWYDPAVPVLLPFGGTTSFPWIFPYFQAIFAGIFGAGLSPMRIVAAVFGTLQIPAIYGLMRALFDRRTGLIAALLLATFPAHVHFSRIGINNIADPLFALLAMMFFVRGMKNGKAFEFAAAGLSLGMTHYFYEGGRLFYTPFFAGWMVFLLIFRVRQSEFHFPSRRNLGIFGAGFLMLAVPLYYAWGVNGYSLTPRYDIVGRNPLWWFQEIASATSIFQGIWNKLETPFMLYVYYPEPGPFYTGGRLLVVAAVPFALLGMITCIWFIRRTGTSLLILWLLACAVAVSFLAGTPQTPRYVVVMPALVGLSALGITTWSGWLKFLPAHWSRFLPYALAIGVAAAQGLYFVTDFLPNYYQRQFYHESVDNVPVRDFDDLLFRLVQLPHNTDVYIVSEAVRGETGFRAFFEYYQRYGSGDLRVLEVTPAQFGETFLMGGLNYGRNQAFFIEPDNEAGIALIKDFFPRANGPQASPYPIPPERQFALFTYAGDEYGNPPRDATRKKPGT